MDREQATRSLRLGVIAFVMPLLFASAAAATPPTKICMTGVCHPSIAEAEYVHGPIASGMCPICHDDGSVPLNLPASHIEVRKDSGRDKCLLCHEEIRALMGLGSVHTPVADGDCVDCHDPHQGDNPFFLKFPPQVEKGRRIFAATCKVCHEAGDPDWFDDFHAGEAVLDCVVCHNTHASSEHLQLTPYVKHVYLKAALLEAGELRGRGRLEAAAEAYVKALSVFPENISTILLLAEIYSSQGEWTRAGREYGKILSLQPENLEGLIGTAEAARHLEGPGAELIYLKKALDVDPDRADLHMRVGLIYKERRQFQEAVSEFAKALKTDPDNGQTHRHLAEVYEAMGMTRDAEEERKIYQELLKE
jgi:predicted CXXCH cytochrome family protein